MKKQMIYKLLDDDRQAFESSFVNTTIRCPFCGLKSSCDLHSTGIAKNIDSGVFILTQCSECGDIFLSHYEYCCGEFIHKCTYPNPIFKHSFQKEVAEFSQDFITIYEQAMTAKHAGLDELVGLGLRRAFEFLIKDYVSNVLKIVPEKTLEKCVKQIPISNVIVNSTLVRWVGNDSTHTETKHREFSVDDMIKSIDIVVSYLYAEYISKKLSGIISK